LYSLIGYRGPMGDTTHVRINESDKEWLEAEFDGTIPSSIGRLIEYYRGAQE